MKNRRHAPITLKPFLNPGLMDKKYVETLCTKSSFLYGKKWRWRKLCAKARCTPEELEKRMDIAINKIKEQYERINEAARKSKSNEGQEIRSRETNDGPITTGSSE